MWIEHARRLSPRNGRRGRDHLTRGEPALRKWALQNGCQVSPRVPYRQRLSMLSAPPPASESSSEHWSDFESVGAPVTRRRCNAHSVFDRSTEVLQVVKAKDCSDLVD